MGDIGIGRQGPRSLSVLENHFIDNRNFPEYNDGRLSISVVNGNNSGRHGGKAGTNRG
jgi:hypothetical protein